MIIKQTFYLKDFNYFLNKSNLSIRHTPLDINRGNSSVGFVFGAKNTSFNEASHIVKSIDWIEDGFEVTVKVLDTINGKIVQKDLSDWEIYPEYSNEIPKVSLDGQIMKQKGTIHAFMLKKKESKHFTEL